MAGKWCRRFRLLCRMIEVDPLVIGNWDLEKGELGFGILKFGRFFFCLGSYQSSGFLCDL